MKLLLTGAFQYSDLQLELLKSSGFEWDYIQDERIPLLSDVSEIEGVICNGLFLYNNIEKFSSLKFIHLTSSGKDRVPIEYIKQNKINLYNAKDIYSIPMAEWTILKILENYKKSRFFYENQFRKKWEKERELYELTAKKVAIVGFGSVGTEVAKRLKAFNVKIIGVGRRDINSDLLDEYHTIEEIDEVLKKSDIIILTLPYTDETKHLINANRMKKMKKDSIIINISRGGLIDQKALVKHLKLNNMMGAALDVFDNEPLNEDSELWDLDNIIITPHNSFVSDKTNERLWKLIFENLKNEKKLLYK